MRMIMKKSIVFATALLATSPVYGAEQTSSQPIQTKTGSAKQVETANVRIPEKLQPKVPNEILREKSNPDNKKLSDYAGKPVLQVNVLGSESIPAESFSAYLSLKTGASFTEEGVVKDCRTIYMTGFYASVTPEITEKENGVIVNYRVKENPAFKQVEVHGTSKLDVQQLPAVLGLRLGERVNMKTVGNNLHIIDEQYKKMGYLLFAVTGIDLTEDGVLHLTFNEGIVEKIKVKGNKRTKAYVIEREIRQGIGEPLNKPLVDRSVQRLYNLGIFDDVDVQVQPGHNPQQVELIVTVEEANTATVGVGTTYSHSDGFVGQFTIGDKNFLGTGDNIQLRWEFGGEDNKNYDLSYTHPYLDNKGTTMSVNLYDNTRESAEYSRGAHEIARFDKRSVGQEITFSRADSEYTYNSIRIKNRKDSYKKPISGYSRQYFEDSYNDEYYARYGKHTTADERRKENFGTTRSITFSRVYDNRDNVQDPHKGKRNEISFEWAGFGGDFNFRKLSFDQRYYWSAGEKGKHTLAFDFGAGYAWGDMPLSQRFYMGGGSTLRGYEDGQFRGNSMLRASLEYRVPVAKKFSVLAFLDSGYAWDKRDESAFDLKKMQFGYGIGVRVHTPLGPVKLDYGFGKNEHGSRRGRFHFSFGGNF